MIVLNLRANRLCIIILQNVYWKEVKNGLTREIIFKFENIDQAWELEKFIQKAPNKIRKEYIRTRQCVYFSKMERSWEEVIDKVQRICFDVQNKLIILTKKMLSLVKFVLSSVTLLVVQDLLKRHGKLNGFAAVINLV